MILNQLNEEVQTRYSRQLLFNGIGREGQAKILASKVALVGCGALGTMQASLLTRAGVGLLRIIDRDFVEESNLQRQILFDEQDARSVMPKAVAAAAKLKAANSLVKIEGIVDDVTFGNIDALLGGFDLIMDATDNFDVRFLLNDYAVKMGIPWIYGACVASYGLSFPVLPGKSACLRCIFEEMPQAGLSPSCDTSGIIGPIVGAIASFQAAEALKVLSGHADLTDRRIRSLDLWDNRNDAIEMPLPNRDCPCCGRREFPYLEGKLGASAAVLCGRNSVQISRPADAEVDLSGLAKKLSTAGQVRSNQHLVRVDVDNFQLTVFANGRAIVHGTSDVAVARSIYARYVGY